MPPPARICARPSRWRIERCCTMAENQQDNGQNLGDDPRWKRLIEKPFRCAPCGGEHRGLFHLVSYAPVYWPDAIAPIANDEINSSEHFVSEDFCVIHGEHFYVRCLLLLPIFGSQNESFGFGVWASLSKENFIRFFNSFNDEKQSELGEMFGWLSTMVPYFESSEPLRCHVLPQDGRRRPLIELEPTQHALAVAQYCGIEFEMVLDIYAAAGHDLRSSPG
jgi:hypothetical protein